MTFRFYIEDESRADLASREYDIAIFCSGYEERSSYVFEGLHELKYKRGVVFSYAGGGDSSVKEFNDEIYKKSKLIFKTFSSGDGYLVAKEVLGLINGIDKNIINVAIDYSSMTRSWYAAILNVARFCFPEKMVELSFIYAVGRHVSQPAVRKISSPVCINGCEGNSMRSDKTVAIVGFGFDEGPPISILEYLEPDVVYGFYANPSAVADYAGRALELNRTLRDAYVKDENIAALPLGSVAATYQGIYEIVLGDLGKASISLLAFGPKPHVLACLLLAMTYKEVACVYASRELLAYPSVPATGELVITKVRPVQTNAGCVGFKGS